jgi:hypothetical protein
VNLDLLVEFNNIILREIGMQFDLVDNWSDSSETEHIKENWDSAVADTDVSDKSLINESFQLSPDFMVRGVLDGVLIFPDHDGCRPVEKI